MTKVRKLTLKEKREDAIGIAETNLRFAIEQRERSQREREGRAKYGDGEVEDGPAHWEGCAEVHPMCRLESALRITYVQLKRERDANVKLDEALEQFASPPEGALF
jgi:hypothetical protein